MAMQPILSVRPDAVFVQSESSEHFHAESPRALARADFLNERRLLALDLSYGMPVSAPMYQYLLDSGITREEYEWFAPRARRRFNAAGRRGVWLLRHHRYHLPVMHTETNIHDVNAAPDYLRKQWANIVRLRQDGVTMLGFTWYSLTDQVDWDTALCEDNHRINPAAWWTSTARCARSAARTRSSSTTGATRRFWGRVLPSDSIADGLCVPAAPRRVSR
jgi:hypothetical protein